MFTPGYLTREEAEQLNALQALVGRLLRQRDAVQPPAYQGGTYGGEGHGVTHNTPFHAIITAGPNSNGLYSWKQVIAYSYGHGYWGDIGGTATLATGPADGDGSGGLIGDMDNIHPAYEANDNIVPVNTVVQMRRACIDTSGSDLDWMYVFDAPGGQSTTQVGPLILDTSTTTYNAPTTVSTTTLTGAVPGSESPGFGTADLTRATLTDGSTADIGKTGFTLTNVTPGSQTSQYSVTVTSAGTLVTPVTVTPTGQTLTGTTAATSTVTPALSQTMTSIGTPAGGFGLSDPVTLTPTTGPAVPVANVAYSFATDATAASYDTQLQYSITDQTATTAYFTVVSTAGVVVNTVKGQLTGASTSSLSVAPTGYITAATVTVTGVPTFPLPVGTLVYNEVDDVLLISKSAVSPVYSEFDPGSGGGGGYHGYADRRHGASGQRQQYANQQHRRG